MQFEMKIKSTFHLSADLNNAIGRLATITGQTNSELVESILRDDGELRKLAHEFTQAKELVEEEVD
jgi:hypothetical protein